MKFQKILCKLYISVIMSVCYCFIWVDLAAKLLMSVLPLTKTCRQIEHVHELDKLEYLTDLGHGWSGTI